MPWSALRSDWRELLFGHFGNERCGVFGGCCFVRRKRGFLRGGVGCGASTAPAASSASTPAAASVGCTGLLLLGRARLVATNTRIFGGVLRSCCGLKRCGLRISVLRLPVASASGIPASAVS